HGVERFLGAEQRIDEVLQLYLSAGGEALYGPFRLEEKPVGTVRQVERAPELTWVSGLFRWRGSSIRAGNIRDPGIERLRTHTFSSHRISDLLSQGREQAEVPA